MPGSSFWVVAWCDQWAGEPSDALATAGERGATVVRSQTMGDSAGCPACIEPALGQFNDAAFERIDYALASARAHGIKIIATLVGDDARNGGTGCVYLGWRGISVPNCSLFNSIVSELSMPRVSSAFR